MKIKLFYSPRLYKSNVFGYQKQPSFIPPLGISTLTSFLKKNNFFVEQDDLDIKVFSDNKDIEIEKKVDMELFDDRKRISNFIKIGKDEQLEDDARKILKKTKYKGFDTIGFSISDDHNFSAIGSTIVLSKIIKEDTGATIMVGGVRHQRKIFEKKLTCLDYIDFIVLQDHITTLRLLEILEAGMLNKKELKGVVYDKKCRKDYLKFKHKNDLIENRTEFKKAENIMPTPDFENLPLDLYIPTFDEFQNDGITIKRTLLLPFSFVRGCLGNCIFCPNSEKPFLETRNPEDVANELKEISRKYDTKCFLFLNTNVNPSCEYANRLANELIRIDADIMWSDCANLKCLDKKLLIKLRKAGAIRLVYGLESASPRMLKFTEKGITPSHAEKILKHAHEAGIWNELELIAGMPHEKESDVEETASFIIRNKPHVNYYYLAKYILMNSKISKFPKKYGIKNIKNNIKTLKDLQLFNRRFDEVNGLKWKEKVNQIEHSFNKLCCAISDTKNPEQWPNQNGYDSQGKILHILYNLYSIFDKKQYVVDYFNGINKRWWMR